MDDIPIGILFAVLIVLLLLSAFFSSSETGLMTLNRYRLRHLAEDKHKGAMRAARLLERPDRLIGLILLGNNFVNILAAVLAAEIAKRLAPQGEVELALALATLILTFVVLIFAEVAPKTIAALHPERIAFPAAWVYVPLLKVLYPLVWAVNAMANVILRAMGVSWKNSKQMTLSREELRTVVNEAGAMIPRSYQRMLVSILDLEKVTVEDIMVPRSEITGIDIEEEWETIVDTLTHSQYTKLPVYRGNIDQVIGFIHLRNVARLLQQEDFQREDLRKVMRDPYFIPEGTPLHKQLLNFQREKRRIGLAVDEYGDIQGLVTLEDILEEIVGEFTTDPASLSKDIHPQDDGGYLVDGSCHVRELNRALRWDLPTDGPKTLNGLILEYMETIPEPGTSLLLHGYPVEIVQTKDNAVKTIVVRPSILEPKEDDTAPTTPKSQ